MIAFKVNNREIKRAITKIKKLKQSAVTQTDKKIEATARRIEGSAKSRVPVYMGRLRSSIDVRGKNLRREVFTPVYYAPYVEFGTKAKADIPAGLESYAMQFKGNRGGGSFNSLLKNIESWVTSKGIPQEAAFHIAVSIARYGVRAQPFLFPAFFREQPKLLNDLKKMLRGLK